MRKTVTPFFHFVGIAGCLLLAGAASAQRTTSTEPTTGLRENRPDLWVLEHATLVSQPGRVIEDATIIIRGTSIQTVRAAAQHSSSTAGQSAIPAGAKRIDLSGHWVYPGLIDAWSEIDVPYSTTDSEATYWNQLISPQRDAARNAEASFADTSADKLRQQGITARLVAPRGGIVKGTSCVVLVTDNATGQRLLRQSVGSHLQLTVPRNGPRPEYPNSPMGATALLRQAMYDADWYQAAQQAYLADGSLQRPEENISLAQLADQMQRGTWIVDAPNERFVLRAERIADEFSLDTIIRGSGREYRLLQQVVDCQRPLLLPVDFPKPPNVADPIAEREVSLQELMHWRLAPENPARLDAAGATICLTSDGLDDIGEFLKQVRRTVEKGLPEDRALAALTTHPARLLGVDDRVGKVEQGMLANLLVSDGPLWEMKTKLTETWVAGERYRHNEDEATSGEYRDRYAGNWQLKLSAKTSWPSTLALELTGKGKSLKGNIRLPATDQPSEDPSPDQEDDEDEATKEPTAQLQSRTLQRDRLQATFDVADLHKKDAEDADKDDEAQEQPKSSPPSGVARLRIVWINQSTASENRPPGRVSIQWPDGAVTAGNANWQPDVQNEEDAETKDEDSKTSDGDGGAAESSTDGEPLDALALRYPLGAFGRSGLPEQPTAVLFRNATVWTCGEAGVIEEGDVLIQDGRIVAVGASLEPPKDCTVVDVKGKHISPGLIDCHSHFATDGGVNESGQAVTAEVRIGDFIDSSDIHIYRQLAGGLTSSNILHGSANPIGGQNQVIKLRWGGDDDQLRFQKAPGGIKFALGENVKRSNWSRPTGRYPETRMGVEQIIRDRFLAARQYDTDWKNWHQGERDQLPPRRDLELEALLEVLKGERWVHCHSYRQDEIVALLDLLEAFHVRIGTLQHILEGYKVADRMAAHGAMGSSFSDWWAYKFEVFDAIPYNGALMHRQGVVVSFNSDDRELARRLNTEAAKATKYGGVPAEEALKFVTLNPAKQLRIDQWVGSLEPGKDADLVVWSDRPLGTFARCEQTWIDGRKYFDRQQDAEQRTADGELRNRLIQQILGGDEPAEKDEKKEIDEEDRWERYDAFCRAHGIVHRDDRRAVSDQRISAQRDDQNE